MRTDYTNGHKLLSEQRQRFVQIRWQVCIQRILKANRHARVQNDRLRQQSEEQKKRRERALLSRTLKKDKPLTKPGVSGPTKQIKTQGIKFTDDMVKECKKQIALENRRVNMQRQVDQQNRYQEQQMQQQNALEIARAIQYGS